MDPVRITTMPFNNRLDLDPAGSEAVLGPFVSLPLPAMPLTVMVWTHPVRGTPLVMWCDDQRIRPCDFAEAWDCIVQFNAHVSPPASTEIASTEPVALDGPVLGEPDFTEPAVTARASAVPASPARASHAFARAAPIAARAVPLADPVAPAVAEPVAPAERVVMPPAPVVAPLVMPEEESAVSIVARDDAARTGAARPYIDPDCPALQSGAEFWRQRMSRY